MVLAQCRQRCYRDSLSPFLQDSMTPCTHWRLLEVISLILSKAETSRTLFEQLQLRSSLGRSNTTTSLSTVTGARRLGTCQPTALRRLQHATTVALICTTLIVACRASRRWRKRRAKTFRWEMHKYGLFDTVGYTRIENMLTEHVSLTADTFPRVRHTSCLPELLLVNAPLTNATASHFHRPAPA